MQELAIPSEASGSAPTRAKQRRISPAVKQALDLLFSGECKTQKAAAERAKISPEYLSRQLALDHVNDYYVRKAKREIRSDLGRAVAVKRALLHSDSDKVANEVANDIMAIAGISVPKQPGITINNTVEAAGYVIKLKSDDDSAKPIDVTPERVGAGGGAE